MELSFDSSVKKDYHATKQKALALDKKILAIKPTSKIKRKPRSLIKYRSDLKANEIWSLILSYLPVVLSGILNKKYVVHLRLLSSAIFILLKKSISLNELNDVAKSLKKYVEQFEILYGKSSITMNIHLLLHMVQAVRNHGRLWCQSTFGFETNNGKLVKNVKGTKNILKQISERYILRKKIEEEYDAYVTKCGTHFLGKGKVVQSSNT